MGTTQALVPRGQNRGISSSPGLQNNTIKREEGLRRGGGKIYNKIIEKVLSRRKLREISKLLLGIPKTATIAHTRIQKESNFASLRGLNSHLRL